MLNRPERALTCKRAAATHFCGYLCPSGLVRRQHCVHVNIQPLANHRAGGQHRSEALLACLPVTATQMKKNIKSLCTAAFMLSCFVHCDIVHTAQRCCIHTCTHVELTVYKTFRSLGFCWPMTIRCPWQGD